MSGLRVTDHSMNKDTILQVKNLSVHFRLEEDVLKAVDGINLDIKHGNTLGIVGESGSGKSVMAQAILRLTPPSGTLEGELLFRSEKEGKIQDFAAMDPYGKEIRRIRGGEIAMIFQEPMEAFSSMYTIGNQIMESILIHITSDKAKAKKIAIKCLEKVGMPQPEQKFNEYPHNLSGGMLQRAMIAMAISCSPSILIADEPTTALDVTVQAQILELMNELKDSLNTSVVFITHDLGVIAEMATEVAVMYLGQIVEYTDVDTLFHGPLHPYTKALMNAFPTLGNKKLEAIKGTIPIPINLPKGCRFYNRCPLAKDGLCNVKDISLEKVNENHYVRCLRWDQ